MKYSFIFVFKLVSMATKATLTLAEKIDRAKDGRSQSWIVNQMNKRGCTEITEVKFSRKKKGHEVFDEAELKALSEILSIEL